MKSISRLVAIIGIWMVATVCTAQTWPSGTTRLVVPFPAGGTTDQLARLFATELQLELGQPVIVENRGGAGGAIAAELVVRSPPDGQTLLFGSNSVLASNVSLYKKLNYNPVTDFSHVMRVGDAPLVLVVKPEFVSTTLAEFVKHAKENPGKLNGGYGSSSVQAALVQLASIADIKVLTVPYKSVPLAAADLLGGVIDFAFLDLGPALSYVRSGKLRALGVAQKGRVALAPDWPAIGDEYPNYGSFAGWFAIAAPAQTPPAVVDRIHASLKRVLDKPDVQAKFSTLGVTSKYLGPADTKAFVVSEVDKWRKAFTQAGVEPQ